MVQGKMNRKDFSINLNAVTEAGGVMEGDEVVLEWGVELV